MPLHSIARSSRSAAITADPSGLDALFSGSERRRATWSFLTWAFVLSEVLRSEDAYALGSRPEVEPSSPPALVQGDDPGARPLSGDEPTLRSWDVAFAPTGLVDDAIAQPHPLPAFASPSANLGPGAGVASRPIQAEAVGLGGGASRGDADPEANLQQTGDSLGIELKVSTPAVDIDLGMSAGLGIHFGGLSLSVLGPMGEGSDDPITTAPLVGIAVPVLEGLESLAQSLTGGLLASGGAINVDSSAADAPDALFANGRYTDYHLALRVEDSGSPSVQASASGGTVSDLTHLIDVVASGHEAQEPASHQVVLPLALEDLALRGSIDHPI